VTSRVRDTYESVFYPGTFSGELPPNPKHRNFPPRIFDEACREAKNNVSIDSTDISYLMSHVLILLNKYANYFGRLSVSV